jgi:hypothetical protein
VTYHFSIPTLCGWYKNGDAWAVSQEKGGVTLERMDGQPKPGAVLHILREIPMPWDTFPETYYEAEEEEED